MVGVEGVEGTAAGAGAAEGVAEAIADVEEGTGTCSTGTTCLEPACATTGTDSSAPAGVVEDVGAAVTGASAGVSEIGIWMRGEA